MAPPNSAVTPPRKPTNSEISTDLDLSSSVRKASLVRGELKDLEAMRKEEGSGGRRASLQKATTQYWEDFSYNLKILRQYPHILAVSFFIFAILCGGALALVFFLANDQNDEDKSEALNLAVETGRWFCKFKMTQWSVWSHLRHSPHSLLSPRANHS